MDETLTTKSQVPDRHKENDRILKSGHFLIFLPITSRLHSFEESSGINNNSTAVSGNLLAYIPQS